MRFGRLGTRDQNEPDIIAALRAAGAVVKQLHDPFDLMVGYRGRLLGMEIKLPLGPRGGERSETGKRAEEQRERQREWAGCFVVVRSPEEAVGALKR